MQIIKSQLSILPGSRRQVRTFIRLKNDVLTSDQSGDGTTDLNKKLGY